MVSRADLLSFIDAAFDELIRIVVDLGDEQANQRLDVDGANSPYAVLTHCLGVLEYWGGEVIAGRVIVRDRPAEFRAHGSVAELAERARLARGQLDRDLTDFDPDAPPRGPVQPLDAIKPLGRTQGGTLVHIYEELAQHLGQVEVTRDVLRADWSRRRPAD
jgi:hypothetical protein